MFTLHTNSANVSETQRAHVMSYSSAKQTDLAFSVATIFHTCERCLDAGWWSCFIFFLAQSKKHVQQVDWRFQGTSWREWVCEWCVCPVWTADLSTVYSYLSTSGCWDEYQQNKRADGLNISIYILFANLSCCGFTPECYVTSVSPIILSKTDALFSQSGTLSSH